MRLVYEVRREVNELGRVRWAIYGGTQGSGVSVWVSPPVAVRGSERSALRAAKRLRRRSAARSWSEDPQ